MNPIKTVAKRLNRAMLRLVSLRENARAFHLLVDGARDYAIFMLDPDGAIQSWSHAAQNMFGYTSDEVIGKPYGTLFQASTDAEQKRPELTIASAHGRYEDDALFLRKDGSTFWANSVICPLWMSGGRLRGYSNVLRDITEQRKTQELLRQKEEALLQALKMEAIGRLAGAIAHDFNNLTTGIIGLSQDVYDELPADDPKREDMKEILQAANRAAGLTRQLLAFARREAVSTQNIELNEVIENLFKMLRRLMGPQVQLDLDLCRDNCWVSIDSGHIEQVVMNLVLNARDAITGRGTITIRTSVLRDHSNSGTGFAQLQIEDTGKGMDETVLKHMFEPFFTTKAKGKGTGLGLATVYGIIRQNHGEISVDSAPGKGACFTILLPLEKENVKKEETNNPIPVSGSSASDTILLAEDEPVVRRSVARTLRKEGFHVLEAADGPEAIALAKSHQGPIPLLLTDIIMPNMDGIQLAEKIKAQLPVIRVLYMSGYADRFLKRETVLSPDFSFIEKPFTPEALIKKIRDVLEKTPL